MFQKTYFKRNVTRYRWISHLKNKCTGNPGAGSGIEHFIEQHWAALCDQILQEVNCTKGSSGGLRMLALLRVSIHWQKKMVLHPNSPFWSPEGITDAVLLIYFCKIMLSPMNAKHPPSTSISMNNVCVNQHTFSVFFLSGHVNFQVIDGFPVYKQNEMPQGCVHLVILVNGKPIHYLKVNMTR